MDKHAPIGVFDSGIGGLTVVREIMRQIPNEKIIYFGDTARTPYGSKSKETVTRYSKQIARFLQTFQVKTIVVACNTASALALEELGECVPAAMNTAEELDARELGRAIDRFLDMLPVTERNLFIARYWTAMPVDRAAAVLRLNASTARSQLSRTRRKLRRFLEQEGLV